MPSTNSLTFRLIAGAAIWTVLGLVVGGFILAEIFRNTVETNFDSQLTFNLDGLIAAAESDAEDHVTLEGRFADPLPVWRRVTAGEIEIERVPGPHVGMVSGDSARVIARQIDRHLAALQGAAETSGRG